MCDFPVLKDVFNLQGLFQDKPLNLSTFQACANPELELYMLAQRKYTTCPRTLNYYPT